ncbi:MAG: glucan 1,4-alpha-glucosidase, partial [Armatimonadetes bacterium]|nr:glucan 1,4-alpha-glucosidase [Armatimonadota bacterium]
RLNTAPEWSGRLKLYVVMAPHIEVRGWHNSARRHRAAGQPVLVAWRRGERATTYAALGCSPPFMRTSCGYSGVSCGWADLMDNMRMDWEFDCAEDGSVAVTGEVDVTRGEFTLGLAFGDSPQAATARLVEALAYPFDSHRRRFVDGWKKHNSAQPERDFDPSRVTGDEGRLFRISYRLLQAHEDKRFAGAFIASPSIPWGEAKGDEYLGGYHLAWPRDMFHVATALMAAGDYAAALRALIYLACSQRPDGSFPANFWLDGTPHNTGLQLDEVAFPVILAWRLWQTDRLEDFDPYPTVMAAARCLLVNGPATEQERWEDASGYSPSTLASNIAALVCAADFAHNRGQSTVASYLLDYADFLESHLEQWTVTNSGTILPDVRCHYIRILPADVRNPRPVEDPDRAVMWIANRPPGSPLEVPAKEVVDAGFLELVRYGIRPADSALIRDSLRVVDAVLKVETPYGPCWRRYTHDGYGQRSDGGPYLGWGRGRAWPLLTGERGHYELAAGGNAHEYIRAMERFAVGCGMLPEQVWDEPDRPDLGLYLGRPTGAAMPLAWAHAEYMKLVRSAWDGEVYDRLPIVADRYLAGRGRKDLEIWKPNRQ